MVRRATNKKRPVLSNQPIYIINPELSFYGLEKQRAALNKTALCDQEWIGVEPTNDGFADQSLTAWVPLRVRLIYQKKGFIVKVTI